MSADQDDNLASKNYARQLAREYAELDDPRVKAQMALDRFWQTKLDDEFEDDDWYECGGFLERHSATPGFHKHRRDRDWRVR
jgi:hypothetical protein